jgi:hypothetical protein
MNDFKEIIKVLKEYLSQRIKSKVLDKDVALLLEINQARFATIKKRNVTPFEDILLFCKRENINVNTIFFEERVKKVII